MILYVTYSKYALQHKMGWEAWSRIYKREVIEKNGLRFIDNKRIFAEDLLFFISYCAVARCIIVLPDYLYHYRIRTGSIMDSNKEALNVGRINELSKAYYYFLQRHQLINLIDDYSLIHYLIVKPELDKAFPGFKGNMKIYHDIIFNDVSDKEFFSKYLKQYMKRNYNNILQWNSHDYLESKMRINFLFKKPITIGLQYIKLRNIK